MDTGYQPAVLVSGIIILSNDSKFKVQRFLLKAKNFTR